jgi:hypothetical protein
VCSIENKGLEEWKSKVFTDNNFEQHFCIVTRVMIIAKFTAPPPPINYLIT